MTQSVLTFLVGVISAGVTYFGLTRTDKNTQKQNAIGLEGIYADHFGEIFDKWQQTQRNLEKTQQRLDKAYKERDSLNETVEALQEKVDALTETITELKEALKRKGDI